VIDCLAATGLNGTGFIIGAAVLLVFGVAFFALARRGRGRVAVLAIGLMLVGGAVITGPTASASASVSASDPCPAAASIPAPTPITVPDLTPIMRFDPTTFTGSTTIQARIQIFEINAVSTTAAQAVIVSIPESSQYTVAPYDPTLVTSVGGPVQNTNWTYLGVFGGTHYFKYIGVALIGASGESDFGFTLDYDPGGSSGVENVVASISDGSGGETNYLNNKDGQTITYSGSP